MGEIGWKETEDSIRLREICEHIVDCEHKTAPIQSHGIPSIRTTNIKNGRLDLENANKVSDKTYRKWTQRLEPRPGDLILAREAPVGEVGIVPPKTRVCLGQRTVLVRPKKEKVDSRYLFFFLLTPKMKHEMICRAEGSTVPHLNMSDIRNLEIPLPLPSLPEQKAIAHVLSTLDDKIELNTRMNRTLEELGQAIFKRWFVDFEFPDEKGRPYKSSGGEMVESEELGQEIPMGWKVGAILEIADLLSGGTPKTKVDEYWGGKIPWVSAKDVTNSQGTFILSTERTITEAGVSNSNAKMLPKNTIVITARGTVGNYCILGRQMTINQTNYGLKAKRDFSDLFVFFMVSNLVSRMKSHSYGTVFDTITTRTFKDMKIIKPPESILYNFYKKIMNPMEQILANLNEIQTLTALRDAFLPRLMSGKLRVKTT